MLDTSTRSHDWRRSFNESLQRFVRQALDHGFFDLPTEVIEFAELERKGEKFYSHWSVQVDEARAVPVGDIGARIQVSLVVEAKKC